MAGARGEATIQTPDGEARILFTNKALADAERATGKTVLELAGGARDGKLGVGDIAQLLLVGMEAARRDARTGGRSHILNDAWAVLDAVGFGTAAAAVIEAMAAVLNYEPGGEGESDPPV